MSRNRKRRLAARALKATGTAATLPEAHRLLRGAAQDAEDRSPRRFSAAVIDAAHTAGIALPRRPFTAHLGLDPDGQAVELDLTASPVIPIVGMSGAGKTRLLASMLAPLVGQHPIAAYGKGAGITADPRSAPLGLVLNDGDPLPLGERIATLEGAAPTGAVRPYVLVIDDPETIWGSSGVAGALGRIAAAGQAVILIALNSHEAATAIQSLLRLTRTVITLDAEAPGVLSVPPPGQLPMIATGRRTGRGTLAAADGAIAFTVPHVDFAALEHFTALLREQHSAG
jgi:hypothetical protein